MCTPLLFIHKTNICFCVQSAHANILHMDFFILFYYLLPFSPHHFTNNIFSVHHTECLVASLQTPLGDSVINTGMKMLIDQFRTDLKSLMDNKEPDIILPSNSIVCWIPQIAYLIVSFQKINCVL